MVVKRKKLTEVCHLTRSLIKLGKSVGRKSRSSIARQVANDRRIKDRVVELLGGNIRREMKTLCSLREISIVRSTSPDTLQYFKWETVIDELQEQAPTLLGFLRGSVQKTRKASPSSQDPKQRTYRVNDTTVTAAILLRHRSQGMNLVQRLIPLLLYSGHAPKQVHIIPLFTSRAITVCVVLCHSADLFMAPEAVAVSLPQKDHCLC